MRLFDVNYLILSYQGVIYTIKALFLISRPCSKCSGRIVYEKKKTVKINE